MLHIHLSHVYNTFRLSYEGQSRHKFYIFVAWRCFSETSTCWAWVQQQQLIRDKKHLSFHHYALKCMVWQGAHICFPPCLNMCRRPVPLLWQRACQHSWPRLESWLPLSLEPPLSSGWRRSHSTPRCSGGSGHHSHLQHRPEGTHTQQIMKLTSWVAFTCDTFSTYTYTEMKNIQAY